MTGSTIWDLLAWVVITWFLLGSIDEGDIWMNTSFSALRAHRAQSPRQP